MLLSCVQGFQTFPSHLFSLRKLKFDLNCQHKGTASKKTGVHTRNNISQEKMNETPKDEGKGHPQDDRNAPALGTTTARL